MILDEPTSIKRASDEELAIMMAESDDQEAFAEIVQRFSHRILAIIYTKIRSTEEAEDILQEVFFGLYKSRHTFDSTRSLESYLFSITQHKLANHLRKKSRDNRCISAGDNMWDWVCNDKSNPEPIEHLQLLEDEQELADGLREMSELRPDLATIFIQYTTENYSIGNLADTHGLTKPQISNRIFSAKENLVRIMRKQREEKQFAASVRLVRSKQEAARKTIKVAPQITKPVPVQAPEEQEQDETPTSSISDSTTSSVIIIDYKEGDDPIDSLPDE